MQTAFAKAAIKSRGNSVYLVHGGSDHTRQPAWYFIRVDAPKVKAFLKAISGGSVALESFGEVLESGYGKEPPLSIVAHMRANYGYTG